MKQVNYPGLVAEDGEGPLRLVRGRINTTSPTILKGTGFSVSRTGTGLVTVTFDVAFSDDPAILLTKGGGTAGMGTSNSVSTTSFQAIITNDAGVGADSTFNFLAIGPI